MNKIEKINIAEDEIDLKELFRTIWRGKLFILGFTVLITFVSVAYVIYQPNIYISQAIFSPTKDSDKKQILPSDLEGFVSISVGQNSGIFETYSELYKNYTFMREFILRYKLYEDFEATANEVYLLGLDLAKKSKNKPFGEIVGGKLSVLQENIIFEIFQSIKKQLTISQNKKTNLIVFSYKSYDRFLNYKILNSFLEYTSEYLKKMELTQLDNQISNLEKEINSVRNIDFRNSILELVTTLFKRRVFLQAEDYTGLNSVVLPEVSHIKDKVGPKRSLVVVVSFVTAFILSIFMIFFREFIQGFKEE